VFYTLRERFNLNTESYLTIKFNSRSNKIIFINSNGLSADMQTHRLVICCVNICTLMRFVFVSFLLFLFFKFDFGNIIIFILLTAFGYLIRI